MTDASHGRASRVIRRTVVALVLVVVVGLAGIGWYYSDQILTPGGGALEETVTQVLAFDGDTVTLDATDDAVAPGQYLVSWEAGGGGYAQICDIVASGGGDVTREVWELDGTLSPGMTVTFDGAWYPQDPAAAFDFPVEEVTYANDLGEFPAYLDRADGGTTWAVLVHGRGATRQETFRMMGVLHDLGMPSLAITYRNDADAPASRSGRYGLGSTEWSDLAAAVRWATGEGAERIVPVGMSTGAQVVSTFLHRAPEADLVDAVIFDAPVLDWGPVLRAAARERGLPTALTSVAMLVAQLRGIPWDELDQVSRAADFDDPILLFHGTADATVPVATSDAFAAAREDLVSYVRVEDAGHVRSWNVDPEDYETAVREFLATAGFAS